MTTADPLLDVLIVEDEALLALDLEMIVDEAGHEVFAHAMSVGDVRALEGRPGPKLAFVDLHLADGESGTSACQWIRRQWPETIVIFVTANPDELPEDFCGGHGVIPKPFSQAGVAAALRYLEDAIADRNAPGPPPASLQPAPGFSG